MQKKYGYWLICLAGLIASPITSAAPTREALLKGCPIPEKRNFPLSTTLKPCDDFYQYVCSESIKKFELPADRSYWDFAFSDSAERLLFAKKNYFKLIDQGYKPESKRAAQLSKFYLSCMNETQSKIEEKKFVAKEVAEIMSLKDWKALVQLARQRMIDGAQYSFLDFSPMADLDDPNQWNVTITANMMTLPERSYYHNPALMKEFEKLVTQFFVEAGLDQPEQRAKWVLDLQTQVADLYPLPAERRERWSQRLYLDRGDWVKKYPNLSFGPFVRTIPKSVKFRNLFPETLEFFNRILPKLPLEQLKSNFIYLSAKDYMDDAYPDFYKKRFAFAHTYFGGPEVRPDRQERCTKETMGKFARELDQDLLPILFPNFPKEKVQKLVDRIKSSILKGLEQNQWLSAGARKAAQEKITKARLFLVSPQDDEEWNFHKLANYNPETPYANRLVYERMGTLEAYEKLKKKRSRKEWSMGPLDVNAYYSSSNDSFTLLQGVLQYPFFDPSESEIEVLGGMGVVIGHELGHGIDDQGSKFDAEGKLHDWMTPADHETFHARSASFVTRYDQAGHNGKLTLGEVIGDHVGLSFSYAATFSSSSPVPADQKKFFESFARTYCSKVRPEMEKVLLKTDPHPLGWARVNEQVIHQAGFYQAYGCKKGDKMFIPEGERVRVW